MKNIFYIHGINSTSLSFNYIWSKLPPHNIQYIEYGFEDDIEKITKKVTTIISNYKDKQFSLVGHSVGGLIAVLSQLNTEINIDKIVTIATPFNGCKLTSVLKRLHPHYTTVINDLKTDSEFISKIRTISLNKPILSIVGTYGKFPKLKEPNDGMMTVQSQKSLTGPKYVEVAANHFEILLHDDTVSTIKNFLIR